jgi:hypothetical protein
VEYGRENRAQSSKTYTINTADYMKIAGDDESPSLATQVLLQGQCCQAHSLLIYEQGREQKNVNREHCLSNHPIWPQKSPAPLSNNFFENQRSNAAPTPFPPCVPRIGKPEARGNPPATPQPYPSRVPRATPPAQRQCRVGNAICPD